MRYTLIIILTGIICALGAQAPSLYSDHKSFQVGDVITVFIVESTSANAAANTETAKSFNHGLNVAAGQGPFDFIPLASFGVDAGATSKGEGTTRRTSSLKGTITAKIVHIDDAGNLLISGTRSVRVNGEEEITTVEGVVRPQDVGANNSVYSYNIADAVIEVKGSGDLRQAAKVGLLTKLFNFIF
ncbi:MAG: flagellar basal body L-ring protein FlgH [Candidatus Cloacimonetes bacterium]|nr:flagellar basal body L-ring protein FlgH [Candidatus Cloacimonadota bacterium]